MIKVISFDLDGTLVDMDYNRIFWDEIVPELYSERHKISLAAAKKIVLNEINSVGAQSLNFYDPHFWFNKFNIGNFSEIVKETKKYVKLYPDVREAMETLGRKYTLIVVSNATKEVVELKIRAEGLEDHFSRIFSVVDDFGALKSAKVFEGIMTRMSIDIHDIVHVGDDVIFDYEIPKSIGIRSFLIDRNGGKKGEDVIKDLRDIEDKIKSID